MKANAPEKIYLTPLECMAASYLPQKDNTIEYTRTDAFIEKAVVWISNNGYIPHSTLEDFRNYME